MAVVATAIALLLARFTGSVMLAAALVAFMLGYMGLMGWWAMRGESKKRD